MKKKIIYCTLAINSLFMGCMKKPELKPDYGPEVSIDKIQGAVSQHSFADATSIYKGQYVSLDQTQVIDTQMPMTVYQRLDQVKDRQEDSNYYYLSFHVKQNEYQSGGTFKQSEQDYNNLVLAKEQSTQALDSKQSATPENQTTSVQQVLDSSTYVPQQVFQPTSVGKIKTMDSGSTLKVTYHNLSESNITIPVPSNIRQKPNCGGVKNCDAGLRLYVVSFDRVVWDADDHGIKTTYRFTYSPDIPTYIHDWDNLGGLYFTNQFETCMQIWMEITQNNQTQTVPVRQCIGVSDFQFGTAPAP